MKTPEEIFDEALQDRGIDRIGLQDSEVYEAGLDAIKQALTTPDVSNALPIGTKVVYEGKTMKITNNREEFWGEPAYRCDYKRDELYIMDDFDSIDLGNDC